MPITARYDQPSFSTGEELRAKLMEALKPHGWENDNELNVRPVREYGPNGWTTVQGEWDVAIRHPLLDTKKGGVWRGTVSGAPNETLMVKEGKGHQMFVGDLFTSRDTGLPTDTKTAPLYTGIQGFGRRIAAAFGGAVAEQAAGRETSVQDKFREVNATQSANAPVYQNPKGETIPGRISGNQVRIEPTASPRDIMYQSYTYNVPMAVDDPEKQQNVQAVVDAVHKQVNTLGSVKREGVIDPFTTLYGGGIHKADKTSSARFITQSAIGTQYYDESGKIKVAALTEKFLKQRYTMGHREIAKPGIVTRGREGAISPLPERFMKEASLTTSGEGLIKGIPMTTATSINPLPWQSGEMQVQLPEELRKYVTDQGGALAATNPDTSRRYNIQGGDSLADVAKNMPEVAYDRLGKELPRGGVDPITIIKGNKEHGIPPLTYTSGAQHEAINEVNLVLPKSWQDTMTEEQMTPHLAALKAKGYNRIGFGDSELTQVELSMTTATPPGWKGAASKGQTNLPLVGVNQQIRTATGNIGYNVLQEAKVLDPVVESALQTMDRGKLAPLMNTLFPEQPVIAEQIMKLAPEQKLSLEDIGLAAGTHETGQHLLSDITSRVVSYGNQQELRENFGIGLVEGRVPLQQFTPETYKDYKAMFVQSAMRRSMGDPSTPDMSELEAEARFKEVIGQHTEFEKGVGPGKQGIYTFWQQGQFLVSPTLKTMVQETEGVASDQGDRARAMMAQGHPGVASWLDANRDIISPDTPARKAIMQASMGWMATQNEAVVDAAQTRAVSGPQAREILSSVFSMTTGKNVPPEYRGELGSARAYQEVMREVTGVGAKEPEPMYWLEGQKTGTMGAEAALELESLQYKLQGEGLVPDTQARITTQWMNNMTRLLEAEASGDVDPDARRRQMVLQSKYTDAEQIRKAKGGIFTRPFASSLLGPGEGALTRTGQERFYRSQGGRGVYSSDEWKRYTDLQRGAAAIHERPPTPNIGTEGMPGSIFAGRMHTPQSRMGGAIQKLIDKSGIMFPDYMTSTFQTATQGDVDIDPMSILPLQLRTKTGDWKKYVPEGGGSQEQYNKWLQGVVGQQGMAQQQGTFDKIYGAAQMQFNPYSSNMISFMNRTLGEGVPVKSLLDKRIALDAQGIQTHIEDWRAAKTVGMGSAYNTFMRRIDVGSTMLGHPERPAAFARDINITPYQSAIDFEPMGTAWEAMMQSGGFYMQDNKSVGFGYHSEQMDKFVLGQWSPSQDTNALAVSLGQTLANQKNVTPEAVAAMVAQTPERGDMDKKQFAQEIERRRGEVTERLRPIMEGREGMSKTAYTVGVGRELMSMTEGADPLVGTRSIAVMSQLSRAFKYTGRDPEKEGAIQRSIDAKGGFTVGGKSVPYEQMRREVSPFSTMYSFAQHVEGTDVGEALYKDPAKIAEAFIAAEKVGATDAPMMKQLARTWGAISGITPAEGGGTMITDPYSKKPMLLREMDDLGRLEQSWKERAFANPYAKTETMLSQFPERTGPGFEAGEKVRSSELAYIGADFSGVDSKPARTGHQAHKYIQEFLDPLVGQEGSSILAVEKKASAGGMKGTIDLLKQTPEGKTIIDWKTGTTSREQYLGQMAGYQYLEPEAERVGIAKIPRGDVTAIRRGMLTKARAERKVASRTPSVKPWQKSESLLGIEKEHQFVTGKMREAQVEVGRLEAIPPEQVTDEGAALDVAKGTSATLAGKRADVATRMSMQAATEYSASEQGQFESDLVSQVSRKRSSLLKAGEEVPADLQKAWEATNEYPKQPMPLRPAVSQQAQGAMGMMPMGRRTPTQERQERVSSRKPLKTYQAEAGEQLYNIGMADVKYFSGEEIGPKTLQKYLTEYAGSKGIDVKAPATHADAVRDYQPHPDPVVEQQRMDRLNAQVGGDKGPPREYGGATVAGTPEEPGDPSGRVTGAGDESVIETIRRVNAAGGPTGGDKPPKKPPWRGGGGGGAQPQRRRGPGQNNLVFQTAVEEFQKTLGRFGESGALTAGKMFTTSGEIVGRVAAQFPEQFRSQITHTAGGEGVAPRRREFADALTEASRIASDENLSLQKMIGQDPKLAAGIRDFRRIAPLFKQVVQMTNDPSTLGMDELLKRKDYAQAHQGIMGVAGGGKQSEQAIADLSEGGGASAKLLPTAYTKMELLSEASKKGTAGILPAGAQGVELASKWVDMINESTTAIEKSSKGMVSFKGEVKDMTEVLNEGLKGPRGEAIKKRMGASFAARLEAEERALGVRKAFDLKGGKGLLTPAEGELIKGSGAFDDKQVSKLRQYYTSLDKTGLRQTQLMEEATGKEAITGEGGATSMGRLSRRMLGGFGLMYMRSIGGIMAGGLTGGYAEQQQQRQAILMGMGASGGAPPAFTPDERLAQAQAVYGGAGWASLKGIQTDIARQPRMQGALGAGQAFVGAAGMALTLGMWGAPVTTPLAVGLGVAAAVGQQAVATYGAYREAEQTGIGMATRMMDATPEETAALRAPSLAQKYQGFIQGLTGVTVAQQKEQAPVEGFLFNWLTRPGDTQYAGWKESPEAVSLTDTLMAIDEARNTGKGVRDTIRELGYDGIEAQKLEAQYWQAASGTEGIDVAAAGFIGAAQLGERYGLDMDQEQQLFLAGAISQQAPWVGMAQQMGQLPYMTREQQQQRAGTTLDLWSEQGGRTAQEVEALASGQQRVAGLGEYGPRPAEEEEEALYERYGDMSQAGYDLLRERYQIGKMRREMGYEFQFPDISQYEGTFTEEQIQEQQRANQRESQLATAQFGVYQGFTGLGMMPNQIDMGEFEGLSIGELGQIGAQQQFGQQLQAILPTAGVPRASAQAMGQAWPGLPPRLAKTMQGMMQGDQMSWAKYAQRSPEEYQQLMGYGAVPGVAGTMIDMSAMGMVDYREVGGGKQLTGMPWGTSSLATANFSSAQMGGRIWGEQEGLSQGLMGAMIEGGTFGGQIWQQQEQAAHQRAMSGIQLQQLQLTKAFQTGVGIGDYAGTINPQTGQPFGIETGRFNVDVRGAGRYTTQGGGLWGIQDAQRGLGWIQQEWGFERQREQTQMQDTFWQQNFDLNRRGAMMQRPWKREDWAYQDTTRALQWQWKKEDFEEESRFMTGRDRFLAERQMGRETIMHGLEGEQIDKGRERQQDLWGLEDERFLMQETQHRQSVEFQKEGIKMQERFYEERKRLEIEQVKLTRAYYTEQMKLQEQQIKAAAAYAQVQAEIAMTMTLFQQGAQALMAQGGLFNEDTWAGLLDIMKEVNPELAEEFWKNILAGLEGSPPGPHGGEETEEETPTPRTKKEYEYDPDDPEAPRQHGGQLLAGQLGLVGEAGPEHFRPYFTGDVLPSYKTNPFEATMISPDADKKEKRVIHLVLNLGDEHFKDYIIDTVDQEIDV